MTVELRVGSRTSRLAMWQSERVITLLQNRFPSLTCTIVPFLTQGDRNLATPLPQMGGKGVFTTELEEALRRGAIDLAVHSLKDLPIEEPQGIALAAICDRADVRDTLIANQGWTLATLPQGAIVGTCSLRRQAQLLALRPDLTIRQIRGNVPTRIEKVRGGDFDATILAAAGVERLGLLHEVAQVLPLAQMLPAPGQGALAVQCRADDESVQTLLAAIDDPSARVATNAERAFLQALGGGCAAPIAAIAVVRGETVTLTGWVGAVDGRESIRVEGSKDAAAWRALAEQLADDALAQGAAKWVSG